MGAFEKELEILIDENDSCTARHGESSVYHGISLEHLKKHNNCIIDPLNTDDRIEDFVKFYYDLLDRRYVHLGALDNAGLQNPNYDTHFCFDIKMLKKQSKEILFLDYDIWTRIAFYEQSEEDFLKYRKKLFLDRYRTEPETEILVDKLDIRNAEYAVVYDKETRSELHDVLQRNKILLPIKECKRVIPEWMNPT